MPLLRKLIKVGNSKAVIIPPDWLRYHEAQSGEPVEVMLMEVDHIITLAPNIITLAPKTDEKDSKK